MGFFVSPRWGLREYRGDDSYRGLTPPGYRLAPRWGLRRILRLGFRPLQGRCVGRVVFTPGFVRYSKTHSRGGCATRCFQRPGLGKFNPFGIRKVRSNEFESATR